MNQPLSLREVQQQVDEWIRTIGVRYFSELTNLGILMEEVGELSRLMVRQYGDQSFKNNENAKGTEEELADILWVVVCLANQMNIDLESAFKKTMEKKSTRDKDRHRNNPKLKS
ncbi:MAG: nucleotide pyrophosphohydrolase [Bacteroidetes bacterium]|nr:nucleotide pyrophosphohydrolase [Bacteroidota bacterium]